MSEERICVRCEKTRLSQYQKGNLCYTCQDKINEQRLQECDKDDQRIEQEVSSRLLDQKNDYITVKEAAAILRCTTRTVRNMIKEGKLKKVTKPLERAWAISREEVYRRYKTLSPIAEEALIINTSCNLTAEFSALENAINILKYPLKSPENIETAAKLIEKIPFRDDTAKLFELFLSPDSPLLKYPDKDEVLIGLRRIFELNRYRKDLSGINLVMRCAHWLARSREEEFVLTVRRSYAAEVNPLVKRSMMLGLAFANAIEPEEILTTFLDEDTNQLLDVLIYQLRTKDILYDLARLVSSHLKIGSEFENSLEEILREFDKVKTEPVRICSLRTLNDILTFGKEKAFVDFKSVLMRVRYRNILNTFLDKTDLDKVWRVEKEKLKNIIMGERGIKNLLETGGLIRA